MLLKINLHSLIGALKMNFKRKNIEFAVAIGLVFAVFLSMARFDAACEDLRTNVLRLHIIANSDSKEDQALKLAVRDRILENSGDIFKDSTTLEDAEKSAIDSLQRFEEIANRVIAENNFDYGCKAEVSDSYFENREYDDFTLPAGTYRSLIIRLGEAKGKNWWCVVFPTVCIPAAGEASLADSTDKVSADVAMQPQKYVVRFKTVEIYEDIKHYISEKI